MPQNSALLAAAIAQAVLAIGHTSMGITMFKNPSFNKLPPVLHGTVKAGWFEGSIFLTIMGLQNYRWSQTGLQGPIDTAIVSLLSTLLLGAGTWYFKLGDKGTGGILSLTGILQLYAAKDALLG